MGVGLFGNGASNVAPSKSTHYGADPAASAPSSEELAEPELPTGLGAPAPIDASDVWVDPGNTNLNGTQLTDVFTNFMAPKICRGRNRQTVVV